MCGRREAEGLRQVLVIEADGVTTIHGLEKLPMVSLLIGRWMA